MSIFMVDVEADGTIPGDYSMILFGAVYVDPEGKLDKVFYGKLKPISDKYVPEALAVSGYTREQTMNFFEPEQTMQWFKNWVLDTNKKHRPIFMSDNNAFDWMFCHWYFEHFLGYKQDPFGWSSRNLNDVFHGIKLNMQASFKGLRKTKHDHNPVNDAKGNAEALLAMRDKYKLKIKL